MAEDAKKDGSADKGFNLMTAFGIPEDRQKILDKATHAIVDGTFMSEDKKEKGFTTTEDAVKYLQTITKDPLELSCMVAGLCGWINRQKSQDPMLQMMNALREQNKSNPEAGTGREV